MEADEDQPPWYLDSDDEDSSDSSRAKNLLDIYIDNLSHVITSLYKLAIAIKSPAPRDRLEKCASIQVDFYKRSDLDHIRHKFPDAPEYLQERFGKVNTRRRQLLKYYELHHQKIADDTMEHRDSKSIAMTTTTVSMVRSNLLPSLDDTEYEGSQCTSFASLTGDDAVINIPEPPDATKAYEGIPFQCPYCHNITRVTTRKSWMYAATSIRCIWR